MISNEELLAHTRADESEIENLRRLEKAAIAFIENRTGRYLGPEAEVVEIVRWRGWPLALANEPIDGTITSLESWNGSAFTTESSTSYYVFGSFIFGESNAYTSLTAPSRFRVTYNAGFTQLDDPDSTDAPEDIKQAVLLLVGHWYENREAVVVGDSATDELPMAVSALIDPHSRVVV